jgi:hypothetical protein
MRPSERLSPLGYCPPRPIRPGETAWDRERCGTCFVVTIIISLATKPRPESELRGLVYAVTEKQQDRTGAWYTTLVSLGIFVLALTLILNIIFF